MHLPNKMKLHFVMKTKLISKNQIQVSMKSQNIRNHFVNILSVKRYRENLL